MPIDQTPFFKARGKTIKREHGYVENDLITPTSALTVYKSMVKMATALSRGLFEFTHLIFTQRRDYLACDSLLHSMSDTERDRFDKQCADTLKSLQSTVARLMDKVKNEKIISKEQKQHLVTVAVLMDGEIKKAANVVTRMRQLRLKSVARKHENSRLLCLVKSEGIATSINRSLRSLRVKKEDHSSQTDISSLESKENIKVEEKDSFFDVEETKEDLDVKMKKNIPFDEFVSTTGEDHEVIELTRDEKAQLELEEDKLFEKYSHVDVEINSLENKMNEIQDLQTTFAEKLMDQEKDIEIINETAMHTTQNLSDGNEWIRQAISNSAGRRVVVLFCTVVLTFTLLFLDWYNA